MSRIPAVVGANTAGDSLEAAALAIEKALSPKEEDRAKSKPAVETPPEAKAEETPAPVVETTAEETPESAEVETPAEEIVQPRKLKVKLPDGEHELPEDEVVKGYLRQQDYTRKTQEAAALRKQHETELTAAKAERLKFAELTTQYHDRLVELTPEEPDWAERQQTMEPGEFAAEYARWDAHKKRIAAAKQASDEALAKVYADKQAEFEQHILAERDKLFEAIPEWKDEKAREPERKAIADYATKELGYTPEDLAQVSDHRAMIVLRKAYLFDKAQKDAKAAAAKAAEKVEPGRVITPKGGVTPPKDKAAAKAAEAKKRLEKSGSVEDAARLFDHILDD